MTVSNTEEFWSIRYPLDIGEDISLHQQGWSVTTVGGSRYDLPPRRGSDLTMAYRAGQIHRPKVPDARPITLLMFMVGWEPETGAAPFDQRTQWNDNWDWLRRLVYRHSALDDQRVVLYRRWRLNPPPDFENDTYRNPFGAKYTDPGAPPKTSRVIPAFALAEMTGNMAPQMTGRFRAEFQMDFTLADPYFYGSWVNARLNAAEDVLVWNDGHDVAGSNYVTVDLIGPLDNPTIFSNAAYPQITVTYNGTIPAGKKVRLTVNKFVAVYSNLDGSSPVNVIAKISNYGSRYWLPLLPGGNPLYLGGNTINGQTASGYAVVSFRPPYV